MTNKDYLNQLHQQHGHLTPELVLEHAKPESSPIHSWFEWNDTEAAHRYRIRQAQELIRSVTVTYSLREKQTVEVRAFHNIDVGNNTRVYLSLDAALADESFKRQLVNQALTEATTFKRKFQTLSEVSGVLEAIEKFIEAEGSKP